MWLFKDLLHKVLSKQISVLTDRSFSWFLVIQMSIEQLQCQSLFQWKGYRNGQDRWSHCWLRSTSNVGNRWNKWLYNDSHQWCGAGAGRSPSDGAKKDLREGGIWATLCVEGTSSCAMVRGYITPEQGDTDLKEGAILELQQQRKAGEMNQRQQRLAYAKYYKTVKWKVDIRIWSFQIENISPTKQKPGLRNSLNKCTKQIRYGGMADEDSYSPWDNNQIVERKNSNPDVRTCDGNVPWMNEKTFCWRIRSGFMRKVQLTFSKQYLWGGTEVGSTEMWRLFIGSRHGQP